MTANRPTIPAPAPDEAAEYYFTYIRQVPPGDVRDHLAAQAAEIRELGAAIGEAASLYRYAPEKWSMREVMSHINDTERLFVQRAFWFARGFDSELPSFDQNVATVAAEANRLSWARQIAEFQTVRAATLSFFENLPDAAWSRRGIASGNPFTVRALAFMCVGHVAHHVRIVRHSYLSQPQVQ